MFDKFGEFDSAEELNRAAAAQKAEGDEEALYALAEENGIEAVEVDDYLDGCVEELVNPLMAAMGKLKVEKEELKSFDGMIMDDWIMYVTECVSESEDMQMAVRKKGNSLKDCIVTLLKWSFENAQPVGEDIAKAAGVPGTLAGNVKLGIPNMRKAKEIIKEYYGRKIDESV